MTKVNFKQLQVKTSLKGDKVVTVDGAADIANILYSHGSGIAAHALALKIYNADGEVEITDAEAAIIEEVVSRVGTPRFIDAILSQLKPE